MLLSLLFTSQMLFSGINLYYTFDYELALCIYCGRHSSPNLWSILLADFVVIACIYTACSATLFKYNYTSCLFLPVQGCGWCWCQHVSKHGRYLFFDFLSQTLGGVRSGQQPWEEYNGSQWSPTIIAAMTHNAMWLYCSLQVSQTPTPSPSPNTCVAYYCPHYNYRTKADSHFKRKRDISGGGGK